MKNNKSSILLATVIILLAIVLHYKLHHKRYQSSDDADKNIETRARLNMGTEFSLFPSTIYRFMEVGLQ